MSSSNSNIRQIEQDIRSIYSAKSRLDSSQRLQLDHLNHLATDQHSLDKLRQQRSSIEEFKRDYEKKGEEVQDYRNEIGRLQDELQSLEDYKAGYEGLLVEVQRRGFELQRWKKEAEQLREQVAKHDRENLGEENRRIQNQVIQLKATLQRKEFGIEQLEQRMDRNSQDWHNQVTALDEQIHQLKMQKNSLEVDLHKSITELSNAKDEIDFLHAQKSNIEQESSIVRQQMQSVKEAANDLEKIIHEQRQGALARQSVIKELELTFEKERRLFQIGNQNSSQIRLALQKEVTECKKRQLNINHQIKQSHLELSDQKARFDRLRQENIKQAAAIQHLKIELANSVRVVNSSASRIKDLEQEAQKREQRHREEMKVEQKIGFTRSGLKSEWRNQGEQMDRLIANLKKLQNK